MLNFDDFDIALDFDDFGEKPEPCGMVLKMLSKERHFLNIGNEIKQLRSIVGEPPKPDEVYKMLSVGGGFSSIGVIKFITLFEKIEQLYVSTFRVGKKQFAELCEMNNRGQLENATIITSATQKKTDELAEYNGEKYNYYDYIKTECAEKGWKLITIDNHSKLILMRTAKNYYIVETSSNLNENPKMEQFSFENDRKLFEWYERLFKEFENYAETADD